MEPDPDFDPIIDFLYAKKLIPRNQHDCHWYNWLILIFWAESASCYWRDPAYCRDLKRSFLQYRHFHENKLISLIPQWQVLDWVIPHFIILNLHFSPCALQNIPLQAMLCLTSLGLLLGFNCTHCGSVVCIPRHESICLSYSCSFLPQPPLRDY